MPLVPDIESSQIPIHYFFLNCLQAKWLVFCFLLLSLFTETL